MKSDLEAVFYIRDETVKETRKVFNGCFEECLKQVNKIWIKEGDDLDEKTKSSFRIGIYVWRAALEKIVEAYNAKDYRYKMVYGYTLTGDRHFAFDGGNLEIVKSVAEDIFQRIYSPMLDILIGYLDEYDNWTEDSKRALISGVVEPASAMGFAKSVNDYVDIYNSIYTDDTLTYEYVFDYVVDKERR